MEIDLTTTNKAGISLQRIFDVLQDKSIAKKDIQAALNTTANIDQLLKKLEDASLIKKDKHGTKVLYSAVVKTEAEPVTKAPVSTTKKTKKIKKDKVETPVVEPLKESVVEVIRVVAEVIQEPAAETVVETVSDPVQEPIVETAQESVTVLVQEPDVESAVEASPVTEDVVTPAVENVVTEVPSAPTRNVEQQPTRRKVTKASPKSDMTPAEVKYINTQTEAISKGHQITTLVQMEQEVKRDKKSAAPKTEEVSKENLEHLRQEMSGRLGKEVTAVLHKRNDRAIKERKKTAQEIYEAQKKKSKKEAEENTFETENPYRFVLNFFTSTLNGEKATPYFRRRDEYVIKSIYNKFKALCETIDNYSVTPQNLPFYRVMTINEQEKLVKIYHIDMNRIVRGVHTLFRLNDFSSDFLKFDQ